MITVYFVCVVVSIAMCYWYFIADVRRSIVQNVMLLVMLLANIGYFSLSISTGLSEAILSQKISYLGGCFMPLLYFMTVCEVCGIHLRKLTSALLIGLQSVLFALVCSVGYSGIYYSDVSMTAYNGVTMLVKTYGPAHVLHPVMMYIYYILSIAVSVYTCAKKRNVNRRELIIMIVSSGLASAVYVLERAFGLQYEILPIAFIVLMLGSLIPIYHSDLYAVTENEVVINEQLENAGFITFNQQLKYMGSNGYAKILFPELRTMNFRHSVKEPSPALAEAIGYVRSLLDHHRSADGHRHSQCDNLKIGNKTYAASIHTLEDFAGACVGATLELRDISEHIRMLELTEKYNEELNRDVEAKTEQIRSIQHKTIQGMAQMVESRDLSTGGHIKRTSDVVRLFALRLLEADMGFDKHFLKLVTRSAPMHDLGKIGVDDAVLRKQGKFTDEEYEKMKKHSEIGGRMVREILTDVESEEFVNVAFNVANYHHEKVNGRGYPCGLKGEEIPIEARIMALADVFDALVSKRCYKDAFSYDKAFEIIHHDAGEHFDKDLAEVFLQCRPELEAYYNNEAIE